ncbi:hypothetical protein I656_03159 [Geobacillus sp. WSUCF1]|nr:hypothetical protein I656_03159 [Geobacillus sp. WSUCF1]
MKNGWDKLSFSLHHHPSRRYARKSARRTWRKMNPFSKKVGCLISLVYSAKVKEGNDS